MTGSIIFNNNHLSIIEPLAGGDISKVYKVKDQQGRYSVVKVWRSAPESFFSAESEGLQRLRESGSGFIVPEVYGTRSQGIWLEWIEPGQPNNESWMSAGLALAKQHTNTSEQFGLATNNFCGRSVQFNKPVADGFQFFADYRIQPQIKKASDQGYLGSEWIAAADNFCNKLPGLVPVQPASLIHGDLWSGNLIFSRTRQPVLIDPASYYGWAEADLAMTCMFGGFSQSFYQSYCEYRSLVPGFKERVSYYNLYHWLNHLNLFGEGYLSQVTQILRPFIMK